MLHFPFLDEFETALTQLLGGSDRERLKVTNQLLEGCIRQDFWLPRCPECSMGVSMGANVFYVVISTLPDTYRGYNVRKAAFIGRVKSFDELDHLIRQYQVERCVISAQPEPHLVHAWAKESGWGYRVYAAVYTNDGIRHPEWCYRDREVKVDRTFALNAAYEEIRTGNWWLPPDAPEIDGGELYAQLKAPTRVRDMTTGELRYKWTESGTLDHYRHAHAFDHIAGFYRSVPRVICI